MDKHYIHITSDCDSNLFIYLFFISTHPHWIIRPSSVGRGSLGAQERIVLVWIGLHVCTWELCHGYRFSRTVLTAKIFQPEDWKRRHGTGFYQKWHYHHDFSSNYDAGHSRYQIFAIKFQKWRVLKIRRWYQLGVYYLVSTKNSALSPHNLNQHYH